MVNYRVKSMNVGSLTSEHMSQPLLTQCIFENIYLVSKSVLSSRAECSASASQCFQREYLVSEMGDIGEGREWQETEKCHSG